MVLFDLNKLLDFFLTQLLRKQVLRLCLNKKLLGNLIKSNKIACEFFFPYLLFLLQNLVYTLDTLLSYLKVSFSML